MKNKIKNHPMLLYPNEVAEICKPLEKLGITYFSHVTVDSENNFTALSKGPELAYHYLKQQYYNADIHMAAADKLGEMVVWDSIALTDKSAALSELGKAHGFYHTFTLIDKQVDASHFYHFATSKFSSTANQVYLSNIDLLKLFVQHFKEQVSGSKQLSEAYEFQFGLVEEVSKGFTLSPDSQLLHANQNRSAVFEEISIKQGVNNVLIHKDTHERVTLSAQQMKCLSLLVKGYAAKQIAFEMNLSVRTVQHYLDRIKVVLGCKNSKEMLVGYAGQL